MTIFRIFIFIESILHFMTLCHNSLKLIITNSMMFVFDGGISNMGLVADPILNVTLIFPTFMC